MKVNIIMIQGGILPGETALATAMFTVYETSEVLLSAGEE